MRCARRCYDRVSVLVGRSGVGKGRHTSVTAIALPVRPAPVSRTGRST